MDSKKITLISLLQNRVTELCEKGDTQEAIHAASAAVEKAEKELSSDVDSIEIFASTLEVRANLYREVGEYEKARADYKQAIDQLEGRLDLAAQLGSLHAGYGAAHDALDQPEKAIVDWEKAMHFFEKSQPPSPLDVASMANNLAFLKKSQGDTDGAENDFLKALEIMHRTVGQNHPETATVCNNLGALYLQAGYDEQAREMHLMSLDVRKKHFGESHPETAQSYNNLALALIKTGDSALAKRHFEAALSGIESCGKEQADELESIAENYINHLNKEGADGLARLVEKRVNDTLKKWGREIALA